MGVSHLWLLLSPSEPNWPSARHLRGPSVLLFAGGAHSSTAAFVLKGEREREKGLKPMACTSSAKGGGHDGNNGIIVVQGITCITVSYSCCWLFSEIIRIPGPATPRVYLVGVMASLNWTGRFIRLFVYLFIYSFIFSWVGFILCWVRLGCVTLALCDYIFLVYLMCACLCLDCPYLLFYKKIFNENNVGRRCT